MTTPVRTFPLDERLARAIAVPGGITVEEALAGAAAAVEEVREECMAALDVKIGEIDALARGGPVICAADTMRIYALANEVLAEAGVFGLSELSEAGRSLCDLTSIWCEGGIPCEALRLHVATMKSLRRPDVGGAPAVRAAVLSGLRAVTAKLSEQARGR